MRKRSWFWKTILFSLAMALATPAFADSIDGNWCSADGQHILIKGKSAVTPSGVHLEGEYNRHFFSYVAPPAEPDAGAKILMRLAGETRVYVSVDGKAGEPQVWKRCEEVSWLMHFAL